MSTEHNPPPPTLEGLIADADAEAAEEHALDEEQRQRPEPAPPPPANAETLQTLNDSIGNDEL